MTASILVIEDDPITRKLLSHHLGKQSYQVFQAVQEGTDASYPELAVQLVRENGIQLVICDLGLPTRTRNQSTLVGLSVVRALQKFNPAPAIISFTGSDDSFALGELHNLGVRAVFDKSDPTAYVQMLSKISELLD